jgi:hypothetical protein
MRLVARSLALTSSFCSSANGVCRSVTIGTSHALPEMTAVSVPSHATTLAQVPSFCEIWISYCVTGRPLTSGVVHDILISTSFLTVVGASGASGSVAA